MAMRNIIRGWTKFSRNRAAVWGLIILLILILIGSLAPYLAPFPEDAGLSVNFAEKLLPPSLRHPLGTDEVGRDVLSRIMFGIRISLSLTLVILFISTPIGILLGITAGYFGGWVEQIIMRITDVFCAIPSLVFALVMSALMKPSLESTIVAIAFVWWRDFCRLAYGETLSIKQEDFVTVARSLGASRFHIMFREIMSNMVSVIIVKTTLDFGYAILVATAISFLGVGAQPPTPELGSMVANARQYLPLYWWPSLFPGLTIFLIVLSLNLVGDGLRDFFGIEV
jgi:peptide/nickel transport system permease protein